MNAILGRAGELGINLIDTAECYGDHYAESLVGTCTSSIRAETKCSRTTDCGKRSPGWALAWCLQHPAVTCVIPGCKNVTRLESNAAAADLEMVKDTHPQA